MDEFQIETAQNVGVNQNVASIGDRMLGYLIDSVVIMLYSICAILLLMQLNLDLGDAWAIYLLVTLPAFLYYVLLETFWNGKTVGKMIMKTRVVKLDGSTPSFANYFVRWILRIVDVALTSGSVAAITILIKGNGQRLGDIAAGTTVISEKQKLTIEDTLVTEIPVNYVPTYSQVTLLNDSDMQTVKNLYDEAIRKGNHNIILNLHHRLIKVMAIETQEKPIDFIATVIKDYNYYTQNM
ncbi:putative RDD family membrane protein YckC [Winogradskyella epiphytica]|uniref:Putative RDD family membrane protein YckC n=1 Tax=Winogradskyella epiphytica TaxID=262005 RepID=A0A2V4WYC9_9FLAO|nr:RDD family protein [Winogradskyella epiphytica]PYE82032.1 putative RDD family membrane protein YckC [Winogradskyella epiphytica]GGW60953.1 RDD family protein [Winogradskyella epiphytica]